jgi:hypothetical protein
MTRDDIIAILAAITLAVMLPVAGAAAALILFPVNRALAHSAPTGWEYDPRCCSGKDCALLPNGSVKALSDGYHIYLEVGQHPMATLQPIQVVIPYNSHKIKESPDGEYHGCFSQQYKNNAGEIFQNSFCLYVPPMGF